MTLSPTELDVTIISVTHNSSQVIGRMLSTVPDGVRVLVVDNASTDQTSNVVSGYPGAEYFALPQNVGFGVACNYGARRSASRFLLFLNPDACLEPDTLHHLCRAAEQTPKGALFNPAQGDFDSGERDLVKIKNASGAALFVRRSDFEEVGGFDENIHLYFEDTDLTRRLCRGDAHAFIVSKARYSHLHSKSSPHTAHVRSYKAFHLARAHLYFLRKYQIPHLYSAILLRAVLKLLNPAGIWNARVRGRNIRRFTGVLSARSRKFVPQIVHYDEDGIPSISFD